MVLSLSLRYKPYTFISVYCFPVFPVILILNSCSYQVVWHKLFTSTGLMHFRWDFLPNRVLHLMFASKILVFISNFILPFFPIAFLQSRCSTSFHLDHLWANLFTHILKHAWMCEPIKVKQRRWKTPWLWKSNAFKFIIKTKQLWKLL